MPGEDYMMWGNPSSTHSIGHGDLFTVRTLTQLIVDHALDIDRKRRWSCLMLGCHIDLLFRIRTKKCVPLVSGYVAVISFLAAIEDVRVKEVAT